MVYERRKKLIITLIALGVLIIGIILCILNEKTNVFGRFYDEIELLCWASHEKLIHILLS